MPEIDALLANGYPTLDMTALALVVPKEALGVPSNLPIAEAQLALITAAHLPVPGVVRNPTSSEWKQAKLDNFVNAYSRPWPTREAAFAREYHGEFVDLEPEPAPRRPFLPPSFAGEEIRIAQEAWPSPQRHHQRRDDRLRAWAEAQERRRQDEEFFVAVDMAIEEDRTGFVAGGDISGNEPPPTVIRRVEPKPAPEPEDEGPRKCVWDWIRKPAV